MNTEGLLSEQTSIADIALQSSTRMYQDYINWEITTSIGMFLHHIETRDLGIVKALWNARKIIICVRPLWYRSLLY